MTFSYTRNELKDGSKAAGITSGTFTNTAVTTGGDIDTGLTRIMHFAISDNNATSKKQSSISGGVVTLTCSAGADGTWMAYGI